jgi:hypothetical protein
MLRLVNSCGAGFGNGGKPGLRRCLVSEVDDGIGPENPDSLTRCLLDNAYEGWRERGKLNPLIFKRIRGLL